ncbi:hypothetical protein [Aporhodopirellula aestuarii]|uniref:Uncharacterized protein n=1 Tax=Aporhodopirellula aestuarii TaxID=2950107 RepID=A0ABT0U1E2_9BACT|nr:hypothetical protein [Aporhodopirellula aestuarii]MCM2370714.1 hypothetical protein [Aporhodopirellula aestuarii]
MNSQTVMVIQLSEQQREEIATILARAIRRTLDKAAAKGTQDTSQRPSQPEVADESQS